MEIVACNICGSNENIVLFSQHDRMFLKKNETKFNVVKCKECGLMFTNPRPTEEEMSFYYPDEYHYIPDSKNQNNTPYTFLISHYNTMKRKILNKYYGYDFPGEGHIDSPTISDYLLEVIRFAFKFFRKDISLFPYKKDGKLLDVGCGSGSTLLYLKEMGWVVYGVEIGHVVAQFARERLNLDVFEGTLLEAKYENNYFDVIMFNNSLEHMHNPLKMRSEANRILKDDGLLIMSIPNTECIDAKLFGKWWYPWELPRHLYHFDRETLKKLLEKAAFYPIRMVSDFVPKNILLNLSFFLRHRFNLKLYPEFLLPLAIPWTYLGQGNILFVHAKKLSGKNL